MTLPDRPTRLCEAAAYAVRLSPDFRKGDRLVILYSHRGQPPGWVVVGYEGDTEAATLDMLHGLQRLFRDRGTDLRLIRDTRTPGPLCQSCPLGHVP